MTSEFGLMQTHGRTMEPAGSSCVAWDEQRIESTLKNLGERIPGIDPALADLSDKAIKLWIYGFLHRARIRGTIAHPFLDSFAKNNFWGKYPFGRTLPGRETYPGGGHYKPHLMVTQSQRTHDFVLAPTKIGGRQPWQLVWARRSLGKPNADEASLLDLIAALLTCGTEAGLFTRMHQDGTKNFYAVSPHAAILTSDRVNLICSESGTIDCSRMSNAVASVQPELPSVTTRLWMNAPLSDPPQWATKSISRLTGSRIRPVGEGLDRHLSTGPVNGTFPFWGTRRRPNRAEMSIDRPGTDGQDSLTHSCIQLQTLVTFQ